MIRETLERLRAEDNLRELPRIEIRGKYVPHRAAFRRHISLRPDGIASGRAAKAAYCAAPSAYQAQTKRIETQ